MTVNVKETGTTDVTGPADSHVRARLVEVDLTIRGTYRKGGIPISAERFGLEQLRDVRVSPDASILLRVHEREAPDLRQHHGARRRPSAARNRDGGRGRRRLAKSYP
jgi:hypothetical protein